VAKEAIIVITNIVFGGKPETIIEVMQEPLLRILLLNLQIPNFILPDVLKILNKLLQIDIDQGDGKYLMTRRLQEVEGVGIIRKLDLSRNKEEYVKALGILLVKNLDDIEKLM
jgi:hypothetical protein